MIVRQTPIDVIEGRSKVAVDNLCITKRRRCMKFLSLKGALAIVAIGSFFMSGDMIAKAGEAKRNDPVVEQAQQADEEEGTVTVSKATLRAMVKRAVEAVVEEVLSGEALSEEGDEDATSRAAFFGCTPNSSVQQVLACLAQIKAQIDVLCAKITRVDNVLFGLECAPLNQG